MRIAWDVHGTGWQLDLTLAPDEGLDGGDGAGGVVELVTDSCVIRLPVPAGDPHPDLAALAALAVVQPWVNRRLFVDRPVSAAFALAVLEGFGVDVGPVDQGLAARPPGGVVGLADDGGVAATAVGMMLPPASVHVFHHRVRHPRVPDRLAPPAPGALRRRIERVRQRGRQVGVVRSDLEYLTLPRPKPPTWPATAVGLVLLADRLDLGAVAFGTGLEARYLDGGRRFTGLHRSPWQGVFAAAGLPLLRPGAGMSRVLALRHCAGPDLADVVHSCPAQSPAGPCLACGTCLVEEVALAALRECRPPAELFRRITAGHPLARRLLTADLPLPMHNVLAYAVSRARIEGTFLERLRDRLWADAESTSWLDRYFRPALACDVPAGWQREMERYVVGRLGFMTATEEAAVRAFDGAGPSWHLPRPSALRPAPDLVGA